MRRSSSFVARFARDTSGAAMVELALVLPLLLLLVFGIFDLGRVFWLESAARKATELSVRMAVVSAPACPGVPATHTLAPGFASAGEGGPRFGRPCRDGNICAIPEPQSCTLVHDSDLDGAANATREAIWENVSRLLPGVVARENLRITYTYHEGLGFLGGGYTPVVSAELVGVEIDLVTPLGRLAQVATGRAAETGGLADVFAIPSMYAALPAENLGHGMGAD